MLNKEILTNVLNDAMEKEIHAEKNCTKILEELELNGFNKMVEKIKNDEIHHQKMVEELKTLVK